MKIPGLKIMIRKPKKGAVLRAALVLMLTGLALGLGALAGSYVAIKDNLPDVTDIDTFRPKLITTVYAADGRPVKEFAEERRVEVAYSRLPLNLINAIVATEDPTFFRHGGVDLRGIVRAVWNDVFKVMGGKRPEGGSTITQQLARSLFLHREVSLRRKLKELYLSRRIEKLYSKEKILELYCNHFFLGHGAYGVQAAANLFFGKDVSALDLEEAAMIAGIFRGPSVYSPYSSKSRTLDRRNHVLNRMVNEGFLSKAEGEAAKARPMDVLPQRRTSVEFGAYFFEEVRRYLEKSYGYDGLYRAGLKVYTTLDPTLQRYAELALRSGLRRVENGLKGWRDDKPNLLTAGPEAVKDLVASPKAPLEEQWLLSWENQAIEPGEAYDAIVLAVSRTEAMVRLKNAVGRMTSKDIGWTKAGRLDAILRKGDVIQVNVLAFDAGANEASVSLTQKPLRNGAFVAIDPRTGQIKALVGGYLYRDSQFNRAVQAPRQTGSVIKPLLYTAALEHGFTPASVIKDEPVTFIDRWNNEPWSPKNYDRQYKGAVTVRTGLEQSRNVVTATLLDNISPQVGVDYCRRFGITSPVYPYLSLSLGTFEITLLEMVSAFSTFPDKGVRFSPYFVTRIEDKDGNVLEEARVESQEVIPPQTAYMMTYLMRGVVESEGGTAGAVSALNWPLAGKTGTTDDYSDAWFMGFSPDLCAGVWVGHDLPVPLGPKQTGAAAALPIWQDFFGRVIEDARKKAQDEGIVDFTPADFEVPENLVFVEIDKKTGLLATPACRYPFREVFFPGTEPSRYCTLADHLRVFDYYSNDKATEEH
ncbi:MAG TPA: PBP1A family penicillin-binding protein [Candidatus Aminicenantes bacterium]|nr:PBP1A family penicillin-binding protein [Candidatus Aminicenantes bacterium]HRY65925.1 PBP1A family penicillin-binding protein [Candidatus Aminicenantes bacterium]HRZ72749.1 PBP1A family penicillin-binding protein [Candidatus Aminicenantes bacterium]